MQRALLILLTACGAAAPTPKGGPRGLRANEHLDVARHHDDAARNASQMPDQRSVPQGFSTVAWTRSWDAGAEHERLAAMHRSRAAALQAAYDEACGARSSDEVAVSPLQRYAIGTWNTSAGVILYLSPKAGPPDRLLADIKCHRAWMMLASGGMEDCPLDLPGIQLDARGDATGITLSIVIRDPKLVEELHRRAAHDLESATRK